MTITMENAVSIVETQKDFTRVARLVDKKGTAVVLKNDMPKYIIFSYAKIKNEISVVGKQNDDIKNIRQLLKKEMAQKGTTATTAVSGAGWEAHVKEQYA